MGYRKQAWQFRVSFRQGGEGVLLPLVAGCPPKQSVLPEYWPLLEVKLPILFQCFMLDSYVVFPSTRSVSAQVTWSIDRWHENAPKVVSESLKFKYFLLLPLHNLSKWIPGHVFTLDLAVNNSVFVTSDQDCQVTICSGIFLYHVMTFSH